MPGPWKLLGETPALSRSQHFANWFSFSGLAVGTLKHVGTEPSNELREISVGHHRLRIFHFDTHDLAQDIAFQLRT